MAMEFTINPVLMGGLIKEVQESCVKIHLHGRLGVITIQKKYITSDIPLQTGCELKFYFSYLRITNEVFAIDKSAMEKLPAFPCMVYATVSEVNDTAIKVEMAEEMGTVAVPLRFVFTDVALQVGQSAEFYLSHMQVVGVRDIPVESI